MAAAKNTEPVSQKHGGKRAGAGRKAVRIDLVELEKLSAMQCTDEEVAAFLNVTVRTIERRREQQPAFAAAMERGRAKGMKAAGKIFQPRVGFCLSARTILLILETVSRHA